MIIQDWFKLKNIESLDSSSRVTPNYNARLWLARAECICMCPFIGAGKLESHHHAYSINNKIIFLRVTNSATVKWLILSDQFLRYNHAKSAARRGAEATARWLITSRAQPRFCQTPRSNFHPIEHWPSLLGTSSKMAKKCKYHTDTEPQTLENGTETQLPLCDTRRTNFQHLRETTCQA